MWCPAVGWNGTFWTWGPVRIMPLQLALDLLFRRLTPVQLNRLCSPWKSPLVLLALLRTHTQILWWVIKTKPCYMESTRSWMANASVPLLCQVGPQLPCSIPLLSLQVSVERLYWLYFWGYSVWHVLCCSAPCTLEFRPVVSVVVIKIDTREVHSQSIGIVWFYVLGRND